MMIQDLNDYKVILIAWDKSIFNEYFIYAKMKRSI